VFVKGVDVSVAGRLRTRCSGIRKMGHDGSVLGGLKGEELKSEAW
jgi:hypothetical protein